jgi:hypothetical protein
LCRDGVVAGFVEVARIGGGYSKCEKSVGRDRVVVSDITEVFLMADCN